MGKTRKWELVPVDVPHRDTAYHSSSLVELLPELLETEILTSRDPRRSPTLPSSSVYSNTYLLDSDDDSSVASGGLPSDNQARSLRIRVHVNPKFFPYASQARDPPTETAAVVPDSTRDTENSPKHTEITESSPQVNFEQGPVDPSSPVTSELGRSQSPATSEPCHPEFPDEEKTITEGKVPTETVIQSDTKDRCLAMESDMGSDDEGLMWDDLSVYDDEELQPPEWNACPETLYPMSTFMKLTLEKNCPVVNSAVIDDILGECREELDRELEMVMKGKVLREKVSHLAPLSAGTQRESSRIDNPAVQLIYLKNLQQWTSRKPLDMLMSGKLDATKLKRPTDIVRQPVIDQIVADDFKSYRRATYGMTCGKPTQRGPGAVFPEVHSATEDTVDQVYSQVQHYMAFLIDKFAETSNTKPTHHSPDNIHKVLDIGGGDAYETKIPEHLQENEVINRKKSAFAPFQHLPKLNMKVTVENAAVDCSLRQALADFRHDLDRLTAFEGLEDTELSAQCSGPNCERGPVIYSPSHPTEKDEVLEQMCESEPPKKRKTSSESHGKHRRRRTKEVEEEQKNTTVKQEDDEGKKSTPSDRRSQGPDEQAAQERTKSAVKRESRHSESRHSRSEESRHSRSEESRRGKRKFSDETPPAAKSSETSETKVKTEDQVTVKRESEKELLVTEDQHKSEKQTSKSSPSKKSRFEMQCEASMAKLHDMERAILKQLLEKPFYKDAYVSLVSDPYSSESLYPNFSSQFDPSLPPCSKFDHPSLLSWALFNHFIHKFDHLFTRLREAPTDSNLFQSQVGEQLDVFFWMLLLSYQDRCPRDGITEPAPLQASTDDTNEYGTAVCDPALNKDNSKEAENTSPTAEEDKLADGKTKGGSKLLMAFRQAVEAKKKKTEDKSKPSKLSPALAAKRAAPKPSKPLYKPTLVLDDVSERVQESKSPQLVVQAESVLDGNVDKSILADDLVKQALVMFSVQARDYVLERLGTSAMNQLVVEILPMIQTCESSRVDRNAVLALSDFLLKSRKSAIDKEMADSGDIFQRVTLRKGLPRVGAISKSVKQEQESGEEHVTADTGAPTKHTVEDSKTSLTKGDKFMASFRQTLIARKKAHKEGQSVGKFATSMAKTAPTTKSKAGAVSSSSSEENAAKIMESLSSFSNMTPPILSTKTPEAPDASVHTIPTVQSRADNTEPEAMDEGSDGEAASYTSQPVIYTTGSTVSAAPTGPTPPVDSTAPVTTDPSVKPAVDSIPLPDFTDDTPPGEDDERQYQAWPPNPPPPWGYGPPPPHMMHYPPGPREPPPGGWGGWSQPGWQGWTP